MMMLWGRFGCVSETSVVAVVRATATTAELSTTGGGGSLPLLHCHPGAEARRATSRHAAARVEAGPARALRGCRRCSAATPCGACSCPSGCPQSRCLRGANARPCLGRGRFRGFATTGRQGFATTPRRRHATTGRGSAIAPQEIVPIIIIITITQYRRRYISVLIIVIVLVVIPRSDTSTDSC